MSDKADLFKVEFSDTIKIIGRSSNGRTHASGAWYLGSNPSLPAKFYTLFIFIFVKLDAKLATFILDCMDSIGLANLSGSKLENLSGQSEEIVSIKEKVSMLTEALYRTTDLFSDAEPLKWSLRESALKIFQEIFALGDSSSIDEPRRLYSIVTGIALMRNKIDLASSGTFITRANFDVLKREYSSLEEKLSVDRLKDRWVPLSITNFAKLPTASSSLSAKNDLEIVEAKKPLENDSQHIPLVSNIVPPKVEYKRHDIGQQQNMSDRKGTLLEAIKKMGPSSVGDLAKIIGQSVSEKTIQRDLNALAESGVLKREGERRWRRYFL